MTNTLTIKLNNNLIEGINKGSIKAIEIVKFLLTTEGITTDKEVNKTAIKDLKVNNGTVVNANIDQFDYTITLEYEVIEVAAAPEVKEEVKATNNNLKSYKFNKKDITVIHNILSDLNNEFTTLKLALKTLKTQFKNESKLLIAELVINNYTDINNYHSGTEVNFRGGTKVYYNINNPEEAYKNALNDDFIPDNKKDTIKVKPYYPTLDIYKSAKLIKDYLITLNQKVS